MELNDALRNEHVRFIKLLTKIRQKHTEVSIMRNNVLEDIAYNHEGGDGAYSLRRQLDRYDNQLDIYSELIHDLESAIDKNNQD